MYKIENYPNCLKLINDWLLQIMLNTLEDKTVPDNFKQMLKEQGIDKKKVIILIESNPRYLFDFFDEHNIIILTTYHENFMFSYTVENLTQNEYYKSRREAEKKAIFIAFTILEENLINKKQ